MTLYEAHDCWKCVEVREVLDRLGLEYDTVQTRGNAAAKALMLGLMGDPVQVPMLVDGELAVWDRRRVIAYLEQTYGEDTSGTPWQQLPVFMGGSCSTDGVCELPQEDARASAARPLDDH
ncbi:MAG: glutathione S-transferase N-terminal domain-containing protein [Thermoleophilia bacterium]|nr:glutathione S-transferase N-terminal domain-containing protein [Thermoleophilia bacterium]MDH3724502.1 glutathione S-transferase N-terminal domain-containing protein [Thermoleophilia bacterium]